MRIGIRLASDPPLKHATRLILARSSIPLPSRLIFLGARDTPFVQMTIDLIVNPIAGKHRGLETLSRVRELLGGNGIELREHISEYAGHSIELSARATTLEPRSQGIIAIGGDGTLFETLNGILRHSDGAMVPIPIGIVPVGTGNSFARDLGIESEESAVTALRGGNRKLVDVGNLSCDAGEFAFINLLGGGFVFAVAHRARRYKRFGALSYVPAVIHETITLKSDRLVLTIDGERIEREAIFFEICNSRFTGGAMKMAPDAEIDDGMFDIVVMSRSSRRKLLSHFPRIFSGTHIDDPLIEVFRGARATAETGRPWLLTPDGETFGSTPISVTILPRSVEMFVS